MSDTHLQAALCKLQFFDAHCDTVMRAFDGDFDFVAGGAAAHTDLPRLLAAGHCAQLFAIFAPQSYYPDRNLRAFAEEIIAKILSWVDAADGRMRLATTAQDVAAACADQPAASATGQSGPSRPLYALLGLEGADPLEGQAENLVYFHGLGVRSLIPAWSDNAFSGTCMGDGAPLTAEGVKLIELAEELGVMVDVSHASDAAFAQICQMARRPFVASHSNCRALCPSPRNLTDDQIRVLAKRGGVMGVNLSADFLAPDYMAQWDAIARPAYAAAALAAHLADRKQMREATSQKLRALPRPPATWIARHVLHAIAVGGEECIGLGGDLDGILTMPAGLTGAESYPAIADLLLDAGLTAAQVEKVCWRNMARVYREVLP